jgi:hypothetical protein
VFTLTASSARITDLYIGNTGTGTTYGIYAGDGLTQLQVSNVIAVLGGNGLKYGIWSQSSITVSNCEMYITSADLNSNGLMIYNDSAATANINANIQNVRVLSTGATLNNRGIVFNNNNTTKTIAGNVTNCNLTAYASTGVTDIALYVNSTTTFNVTVNAYNSLFSGADSDVTVISTNSCTLTNCTLVNGTVTGTVVYAGTQVVGKVNGNTITTGTGVLTLAVGKTLTASNSLTLAGTDATTHTFPTTSSSVARTDAAQTFTGTQTITGQLRVNSTYSSLSNPVSLVGQQTRFDLTTYNSNFGASATLGLLTILNNVTTGQNTSYIKQFNHNSGADDSVMVFTSGNASTVQFPFYGAGAATFSASGVISSVSDETWKTKDGMPSNPDAMLKKLQPGYWYYNAEKAPIYGVERQL